MTCEECKAMRAAELVAKPPETVPYLVHESAMARSERAQKRLWITILLLIVLLVGSNCAWTYYESQFEDTVTTIEADTTDGGTAIANGEGSVTYNGNGESNGQETHP